MDKQKADSMECGYIGKFAGNVLKRWRLLLIFFLAFFMVSLYAVKQAQERYCDEALVILGSRGDQMDRKVMIEDPYVALSRLNVAIAGVDSIDGTANATLDAFDFEKRRVITLSMKGSDPRKVRAALKRVLATLSRVHEEKYALAVADYDARKSYLKKACIMLERMISILSSDRDIPPEYYQNLQIELVKVRGTIPPSPEQTRFILPDSAEAKLCGAKSMAEMVFFSLGWGLIGSLMALFGVHIWQSHFARGYRK